MNPGFAPDKRVNILRIVFIAEVPFKPPFNIDLSRAWF